MSKIQLPLQKLKFTLHSIVAHVVTGLFWIFKCFFNLTGEWARLILSPIVSRKYRNWTSAVHLAAVWTMECMGADNNRPFDSRSLNIKMIFLNFIAFRMLPLLPFCCRDFYRAVHRHGDKLIARVIWRFVGFNINYLLVVLFLNGECPIYYIKRTSNHCISWLSWN